MHVIFRFILTLVFFSQPLIAEAKTPRIVITIKPLYGIVSAVTEGVTKPTLLLRQKDSPHDYSLKPSDMSKLSNADFVFLVDKKFEAFLKKAVSNLPKKTKVIEITKVKGLNRLPLRENTLWEDKEDDHHHMHEHEDAEYDNHVWLNPKNAILITDVITEELSKFDKAHAKKYKANSIKFINELRLLDNEMAAKLESVRDKPYIVFHDAYQYFEKNYNLHSIGAIYLNPERQLSAKKVKEIRALIKEKNVKCLFSEPQFSSTLINAIVNKTRANAGVLDAEWGENKPNENEYIGLIRNLGDSLKSCLGN
jgi:zinc transport system substrate-binding protein